MRTATLFASERTCLILERKSDNYNDGLLGAPVGIRTPNLLIRSQMLYLVVLQG